MKRVYASVTLVGIVGLAYAVMHGYQSYQSEVESRLVVFDKEAATTADLVDRRVLRMEATFELEVPMFEQFLTERERTDDEITDYLRERTRKLSTGVNANYIDLLCAYRGKYYCGNYWRPGPDFDLNKRPWYTNAVNNPGKTVVTPPYAPYDYPHEVMAVGRKLAVPDTVLSMDVQLSSVEPAAGISLVGGNGISFFIDHVGKVVTSQGEREICGVDMEKIAEKIMDGAPDRFEESGYCVFHCHGKSGWTSVILYSKEELYRTARPLLFAPAVWALLVFALVLLTMELVRYRKDIFSQWRSSKTPLRTRLVIPSVYMAVIVVFMCTFLYMRHDAMRRGYENAIDRVEARLTEIAVPYEAFINTAKGAAGYCSRHLEPMVLGGMSDQEIAQETSRLVGIYRSLYGRNYRNIFIANRRRYVDSMDYRRAATFDIAKQKWYLDAAANPNVNFVSVPYISKVDGVEQISITRSMTDDERTVVGIDISVKMLRTICGRIHMPGARCALLLAENGYVIDHHVISEDEEHPEADIKAVAARAMTEGSTFRMGEGDGERVMFSVPLAIGGRLVVSADAKLIDNTIAAYRMRSYAWQIPLFVALLILIYLALRRMRSTRERDIAEFERERQSEALSKALELAQSANRAKSLFLGSMSHDLRTPMNAILGFAKLADSDLDDKPKVKDCLGKISNAAEQLLTIINGVLEMCQLEAGRTTMTWRPEKLSEILSGLDTQLRQRAEKKSLEFIVEKPADDAMILCDRVRLNQVLINIALNAITYTNENGRVKISVGTAPGADETRVRCEFTIEDNGIGMSPEFAEKVFEPFARESTATISGITGNGLGLSITKRLVEMMGGKIRLTTKLGAGSTFRVSIEFRRCTPDGE